jgi:hypothetical protein
MKKSFLIILWLLSYSCANTQYVPLYEGPCVDRAIKTRQYFIDKNYETKLVVGIIKYNGKEIGHMWIKYKKTSDTQWKNYFNLESKKIIE